MALVLVGESGVGKTNLLCHWAQELLAEQHAVFFYNCGGSIGPDVEREVAQSLYLGDSEQLQPALDRISGLAVATARQFVLIFDSINEFHRGEQNGPAELIKQIDNLVQYLPDKNVRVLLSCNAAVWSQIERLDGANLHWSRYFQPAGAEPLLRLDLFAPQQFSDAYERYRRFFRLQTTLDGLPSVLRERLQKPLLLRMLAETYRDQAVHITLNDLSLGIFRRYYEDRVRRRRDQLFIDELVAEMLAGRRSTLPLDDLVRNSVLSPEILDEDSDSSYYRMLDESILTEMSGDLFIGDVVKFTYTQVGAYALARHVVRQGVGADVIIKLIREAGELLMAWDAARILLLLHKNPAIFAALAQSTDVELRELAAEGLAELHADDPAAATEMIIELLQMNSEEARRTGLKAAYYIGARGQEIFLWAAVKGEPALRRATKDILYLIWKTDPDFTFGILSKLVDQISLRDLRELRNIGEFAIELPVTIYMNHCEREELIPQITSIHYEMTKNKLHLDLLNTGILGPAFEKLVFQTVASGLTKPMLDTFLFTEIFYGETSTFRGRFDAVLLPLGLAYGKRGARMSFFDVLIQDALARGDARLLGRCVAALGSVGFYYPEAVFQTLRPVMSMPGDTDLQSVLVRTLATIRTQHFDAVDIFLRQIGTDESFRRRVAAAADVELVRRYIYWLGFYNNTVHFALVYPRLRERLTVRSLQILADARGPVDFLAGYTMIVMQMTRESDFRLSEWTRRD